MNMRVVCRVACLGMQNSGAPAPDSTISPRRPAAPRGRRAGMILIVTKPDDEHADYITQKLEERGVEVARFDPADFPARSEISLGYTAAGPHYTLRTAGTSIDLDRVSATWYRRPELPAPHAEITDPAAHRYVAEECRAFVQDVWASLRCTWLPAPPAAVREAQYKTAQLRVAHSLGFELPPTLVTNSPADFLEFYRRNNGNVVSKLAGIAFFRAIGSTFCRYTEAVSRRDLGYANSIRYVPAIFQAYVPKRLELRITVVGQQVFAAEIHSQTTNHTRHDWRRYDIDQTPHLPHELPDEIAQRCVRLTEELGLCYGAIDMILTPEGRYVFIEINPNGQYLWIEELTGLPISDAICDLLMSAAPVRQPVTPGDRLLQEALR
jgi:hypothetical protein